MSRTERGVQFLGAIRPQLPAGQLLDRISTNVSITSDLNDLRDHAHATERAATEPPSFAYQPALDGVRAVSVLLVLFFHAGLPFLTAGYLGVSVFFTLSGYLITSLLLIERARTGTIRVGAFYGRRVKRLLPASMICVVSVVVARQLGAFADVADLRTDVISGVLQVFNWAQLAGSGSYGDLFGTATSPLEHYWSLAIEEQFYWVWPLVVLAVVRRPAARHPRRRRLTALLALATVGFAIVAPIVAMLWGPDAAYWATPARLAEILVGALLAALLHGRRVPANARRLAFPALAVIVAASIVLPSDRGPAYEGWLPLFAVFTALLIYSLQTDGWVRRVLSSRPLVAVGTISYGLYLYHWPVFVLLRERGWNLTTVPGLTVALGITFAISIVSSRMIERPVRRARWQPRPTLRTAGFATAVVLASSLLVGPGAVSIRADDELLGAAAIDPADANIPLTPLTPLASPPPDPGDRSTPVSADRLAGPIDPARENDDRVETATTDRPAGATAEVETSVELLPTPTRPVRILVVGDSTALYVGQGLAEWSTTVPDHAQVSVSWCQGCTFELESTITTFDVEGVEENSRRTMLEVVPDAVRKLRPDVVVMMVTVSDVANREWSTAEGSIGPLDARYRDRMERAYAHHTMELIQMGVEDVVWVVPPTPYHLWNEPEMNESERYAAHHDIVRDVAGRFASHVSLVDLDAWVTASGFARDDGFRADGVHIDQEPAAALAETFLGPWLVRDALTAES